MKPAVFEPPSLDDWPKVNWTPDVEKSKRVDLNTLTNAEVASWKAGETLLLTGKMLTRRDEVVGAAGPTTATRMDKFTEMMLAQTGLISMIGKAERGPVAIEAIKKRKSAYLMAVGGAAYLVARAIKGAKVAGFADLGMEAIYEFDVKDMPVTVAVDSSGTSAHITGPAVWSQRIHDLKIPLKVA